MTKFTKIAFDMDLDKVMADPADYGVSMLIYGILGKDNTEAFYKVLDSITAPEDAYLVLQTNRIDKNDKPYYDKLMEIAITEPKYAFSLLYQGKLNKDSILFNKALRNVSRNSVYANDLIKDNKISKSDVDMDLWKNLVYSAEKINPEISKGAKKVSAENSCWSFDEMLDNWEVTAECMDDDLREEIHSDLAPCTNEEFLEEYCVRHLEKFGEPFCIN